AVDVELDLADRRGDRVVGAGVVQGPRGSGAHRLQRATGVGAGVVILLLGGEDEQRVRRVDAVGREASEERREPGIGVGEVLLAAGVAWPHRVAGGAAPRLSRRAAVRELLVVHVGDVAVDDGYPGFEHVRDVGEALRRRRAEAREAGIELWRPRLSRME